MFQYLHFTIKNKTFWTLCEDKKLKSDDLLKSFSTSEPSWMDESFNRQNVFTISLTQIK